MSEEIIGTKESYLDVVEYLRWKKNKLFYWVFCGIASGLISFFFAMQEDVPMYSNLFSFGLIFFLNSKLMPSASRLGAKVITKKNWKGLLSGKIHLELDITQPKGLRKIFTDGDVVPSPPALGVSLSKIETIRGHTVIFCDIGKYKNQIWFVADLDVTSLLNAWVVLNDEKQRT